MKLKELTWGQIRKDRLCVSKSLMPFKLAKQKRFLFVHGVGVNLYNLSAVGIKELLLFSQGEEYSTQVYLENIPNRYGTSCMVSLSEIRTLLNDELLPKDAGSGTKILEGYIRK